MSLKKFYDREAEQSFLVEEASLSQSLKSARLVVVTGRRRVGKTELLLRSLSKSGEVPFIYLFATRLTARALISEWVRSIASVIDMPFLPQFDRLSQVVEYLLYVARTRPIHVAIDECQDLNVIEPSFWSEVQRIWDLNKQGAQMLLVMSGSVASAMRNIFQGYSEPLYGRVDKFIFVRPFEIGTIDAILADYSPTHTDEDLLALYTLTGGVVWFIEELMVRGAFTLETMAETVFEAGSKFAMDGEVLLANEFRHDATVNRTLLHAIAAGKTKREELQALIPDTNISGALSRLENHYELIRENKPVLSPNYRRTRYQITDRYLAFWFSFVAGQSSLLAQNNFDGMRKGFLSAYSDFSGRALEQCFKDTLRASHLFTEIGPWWDRKGLNEIDIVALRDDEIFFFEVKRAKRKYSAAQLSAKVKAFLSLVPKLQGRQIRIGGLSLADLRKTPEDMISEAQVVEMTAFD